MKTFVKIISWYKLKNDFKKLLILLIKTPASNVVILKKRIKGTWSVMLPRNASFTTKSLKLNDHVMHFYF